MISTPLISSSSSGTWGFYHVYDPDRISVMVDHLYPTCLDDDPRCFRYSRRFQDEYGVKRLYVADGISHQLALASVWPPPARSSSARTATPPLRCRGRLRLRRRLYGDGLHHRLRAAVGPGPLRHQGGGERDPAQRCLSQGHHPAGTGRPDCRRCHLQVPGIHRLYHSAAQHLRPGRHRQHGSGVRGQGGPVRPGRKKTAAFCGVDLADCDWLRFDGDARYERVLTYDAGTFRPYLSCPYGVDNVHPIEDVAGTPVDQVFIGSCTNGRLEDLAAAAAVLKGHAIAPFVRLIVTPASRAVYREAARLGYLKTLVEAGAMVTHPYCSLCQGPQRRSGQRSAGGRRHPQPQLHRPYGQPCRPDFSGQSRSGRGLRAGGTHRRPRALFVTVPDQARFRGTQHRPPAVWCSRGLCSVRVG